MADRVVTVKLRVEDQFSQPVNAYTQKMTQAEQATKRMSDSARQSSSAFGGMGTAITGAVAAFGVMGVARFAEGLYTAGMQAQRTGMLFESFGAQVGSTSALLERLRGTTRGVVSDTALMAAASQQLSMGLAQNANDVNRLMNIGVTFAQAQGQDVGASLENLNMILANQSYLRLDTLGISSSQVRELAGQYRQAGMDSSEAFNAAFMDVAEQKLPQMAAVADATTTELQKLQTGWDNWWTDFGERFAQGVNGLIGMVTHLGEIAGLVLAGLPGGSGNGGVVPTDVGTSMGNGGIDPTTGRPTTAMLAQMIRMQARNGNYAYFNDPQFQGEYGAAGWLAGADSRALNGANYGANGRQGSTDVMLAYRARLVAQQLLQSQLYDASRMMAGSGLTGVGDISSYMNGPANFQGALGRLTGGFNSAMMNGFVGGGTGVNLFSERSVETMRGIQTAMDGLLASAEQMHDQGLISDSAVEPFRQAATWMSQVKTDAEGARAAIDAMSLSQLFGQQSGGRTGEISGGLLSLLQSRGVEGDALQGLQDALFMNSGQETAASLQFRDNVLPMIADIYTQFGTDAAIEAINAYNAAAAYTATTSGLGATVNLTAALGYTRNGNGAGSGPGNSYTVQPGDTASAIAARFGVGVGDFGLSNPSLIVPGQELSWGGGGAGGLTQLNRFAAADDIATAMSDAETSASNITDSMQTAAETLQSGIDAVFGKSYQLPIELVISGGGILAQLIAAAVGANGGTVPGSTNNPGRSNAGTRNGSNRPVNTSAAIGGGV